MPEPPGYLVDRDPWARAVEAKKCTRGALVEARAPLSVERLDPFVEPSLCVAHLTKATGGAPVPTAE